METLTKTKYLAISSKGEIDVKAFKLIGASTKTNDSSKIGMFGSGIKYSIAFLLRNKINFKIFSGNKEIKVTTKVEKFRNQVFEKILINGQETSFVTDMGMDWEPWFVIREIYANAIDEGEPVISQPKTITKHEGRTKFYIEITPAIQEVLDNWELYFSEGRRDLLFESEQGIKVYSGGNDFVVYRKGIRVLIKKRERSVFHYDFPNIGINESRVIPSEFRFQLELMEFLCRNASEEIVKRLMKNMIGSYEERLDWKDYGYTLGENWEKALENRYVVDNENAGHYEEMVRANNPIHLPKQLTDSIVEKIGYDKHVGGKDAHKGIKKIDHSDKENFMIKQLEDFCKQCEYEIKYPIFVVQFTKKGIVGMANMEDKEIYLGKSAFESFDLLIKTAIEENEHINTGFGDNSREFQNHWIGLFIKEKLSRFTYTV